MFMFSSYLLDTIHFHQQAAKEQTQDLIVKTNKLQGEKWVDSKWVQTYTCVSACVLVRKVNLVTWHKQVCWIWKKKKK